MLLFLLACVSVESPPSKIISNTGSWTGSSTVCLNGNEDSYSEDGLYTIRGRFIRDEALYEDFDDNLVPCMDTPTRVVVVRDDADNVFNLGYSRRDVGGWDITPPIPGLVDGDQISLTLRQGAADSAGFSLTDLNGNTVYALESNRGRPGLQENDVPGLSYSIGLISDVYSSSACDEVYVRPMLIEFGNISFSLVEGQFVSGENYTFYGIASREFLGDCEDPYLFSWLLVGNIY